MPVKTINGNIFYEMAPKLQFLTRNDKFSQEKTAIENDECRIIFDGIILNNRSLFEQFSCDDNAELIWKLYSQYGADMVMYAKGIYALCIWDKRQNKVLITNDLLSKRAIYYHINEKGICFAGSYFDLLDLLAQTEHTLKINISAVKDMAGFGYLKGNATYLEDVFYLNAFESIVVDLKENTTQLIQHKPAAAPNAENEDALVDRFDALFTNAVKLQFEKNAEYGYQQVATLSGGMDSRACLLKGVNVGYTKDILCFSYAQSGSLDFTISQQIATDLGFDYLFYPMDSALFIPRYQNPMARNECQQRAVGSTAATIMADLLNTDGFGIIHTGLLGGELMGDMVYVASDAKRDSLLRKARRALLGVDLKRHTLVNDFNILLDQLRACQNFAYMFLGRCEALSPFLDEDVFMFLAGVDPKYLYGRKLYTRWMRKYAPNPYIATHTGCTVDASPLKILATKTFYTLQKKLFGKSTRDMNPFNFWFEKKPEYKRIFTDDFEKLCQTLYADERMAEVVKTAQMSWGNDWMKNACVLTALHAVETTCQKVYTGSKEG